MPLEQLRGGAQVVLQQMLFTQWLDAHCSSTSMLVAPHPLPLPYFTTHDGKVEFVKQKRFEAPGQVLPGQQAFPATPQVTTHEPPWQTS